MAPAHASAATPLNHGESSRTPATSFQLHQYADADFVPEVEGSAGVHPLCSYALDITCSENTGKRFYDYFNQGNINGLFMLTKYFPQRISNFPQGTFILHGFNNNGN